MAYEQETNGILVSVQTLYLPEQSEPGVGRHMWAYTIRIENHGADTVQLINRHWRITDAMGRSQEVRGPGVVGEQPILDPGDSFEYTSGTPLDSESGFMVGTYEMQRKDGDMFHVNIPAFPLDTPQSSPVLH